MSTNAAKTRRLVAKRAAESKIALIDVIRFLRGADLDWKEGSAHMFCLAHGLIDVAYGKYVVTSAGRAAAGL